MRPASDDGKMIVRTDDGALYLWGTVFLPGNVQDAVTLDTPTLLCEAVADAVPCYAGVLILTLSGELLVCAWNGKALENSPVGLF